MVTGVYQKASGEVFYQGKLINFRISHDALQNGIATIYQEFNLIPLYS
ncbi:MAG TPA: hypothetical protein PK016_08135 [Candidatus Atribacteria bacterium]|nr:hypothetical protein [Candidatus Atribacteria bacterium]